MSIDKAIQSKVLHFCDALQSFLHQWNVFVLFLSTFLRYTYKVPQLKGEKVVLEYLWVFEKFEDLKYQNLWL